MNPQPNVYRWYEFSQLLQSAQPRLGKNVSLQDAWTRSGSASEFYIEPMLPHVGDIDLMISSNKQLVVPEGHQIPQYIQLPVEFHTSSEI